MNRTAIYARKACPNEATLNRQVQVLQGLAANLGLNVTRTIRIAASGLDFARQGLRELMRLIKAHEVDTILMKDLARIGRDIPKVIVVLEELDKYGITLIIQGGDTVETSNPLCALLLRFAPYPSLEVVLASTAEKRPML